MTYCLPILPFDLFLYFSHVFIYYPGFICKKQKTIHIYTNTFTPFTIPPYHDGPTSSRQITEVKHRRAEIVLGWGTAWELSVWYTYYEIR